MVKDFLTKTKENTSKRTVILRRLVKDIKLKLPWFLCLGMQKFHNIIIVTILLAKE